MFWGRLSAQAQVVHRCLAVSPRAMSAGELCARTGLPVAVVAQAIDELVGAHRVTVANDATLVLQRRPVAPEVRASSSHDNRRWQHLLTVNDETDPLLELVRGAERTVERIAALNLARPRELLSVSPRPAGPVRPSVNDPMVASLQAGGTSVWITDERRVLHPAWQPVIQRHLGHGEQIYTVPDMAHRSSSTTGGWPS